MPLLLKPDPGPCPVDDAPHHTCVAPEPPARVTPPRDGPRLPRSVIVRGGPAPGALTTGTYTRARRRELERAAAPPPPTETP